MDFDWLFPFLDNKIQLILFLHYDWNLHERFYAAEGLAPEYMPPKSPRNNY